MGTEAFATIEVARAIAEKMAKWPVAEFAIREPDKLWQALIDAEREHNQALELGPAAAEAVKSYRIQVVAIQSALEAIESADYVLAEHHDNLRRVLRAAIKEFDKRIDLFGETRDPITGKQPRLIRSPGLKVKSDGIDALVAVLASYWFANSEKEFSESIIDAEDKEEGSIEPNSPALALVFEAARRIDARYSLQTCAHAMRRYRDRANKVDLADLVR